MCATEFALKFESTDSIKDAKKKLFEFQKKVETHIELHVCKVSLDSLRTKLSKEFFTTECTAFETTQQTNVTKLQQKLGIDVDADVASPATAVTKKTPGKLYEQIFKGCSDKVAKEEAAIKENEKKEKEKKERLAALSQKDLLSRTIRYETEAILQERGLQQPQKNRFNNKKKKADDVIDEHVDYTRAYSLSANGVNDLGPAVVMPQHDPSLFYMARQKTKPKAKAKAKASPKAKAKPSAKKKNTMNQELGDNGNNSSGKNSKGKGKGKGKTKGKGKGFGRQPKTAEDHKGARKGDGKAAPHKGGKGGKKGGGYGKGKNGKQGK